MILLRHDSVVPDDDVEFSASKQLLLNGDPQVFVHLGPCTLVTASDAYDNLILELPQMLPVWDALDRACCALLCELVKNDEVQLPANMHISETTVKQLWHPKMKVGDDGFAEISLKRAHSTWRLFDGDGIEAPNTKIDDVPAGANVDAIVHIVGWYAMRGYVGLTARLVQLRLLPDDEEEIGF